VESLFMSGIHPATPAHQIDKDKITLLINNIKLILTHSIGQGGSSLKDFSIGAGKTGYFQQTLLAYGRAGQPCTVCHEPLSSIKIGGRASVYCPNCQPFNPSA
jgi:DNA-formamidopyrimidine glycosylase